ncbi:hypothetical protein O6H91_05G052500 [Diphasiastrum complanatum]|uniref:Uncharacterized protein n=1 Tax=Diphasiastrum complanatum TaxID=34168 RepID=A0ACC2DN81_DIPCM|nr:hypothetical protein O6H91_05G052500 [Diphasiastrum complanatum]
MSYAAFKMVHSPTGVENCVAAFLTHSAAPSGSSNNSMMQVDLPSSPSGFPEHSSAAAGQWGFSPRVRDTGSGGEFLPNLVVTKGNVLEVYRLRLQTGKARSSRGSETGMALGAKREGDIAGISSAWLELICHHRLNGNVESMAVLSHGRDGRLRRDAIMLTFRDAKISVLDFDEAKHSLRTSSLHYFEGPDFQHLKRGREKFPRGPLVRSDPHGRCAGVLLYGCQLVLMKAAQVGYDLGEEDESTATSVIAYAHIEFSYVVSLRDMEMKHIKDFVFLHGYIEPVVLVLHEKEPTWAGRVAMKSHTSIITALSINTTLKQHPLIWSADNLPYDAYKLLAVPAPIGGVLVVCANSLHYHSQSSSCSLALNDFAVSPEGSTEFPKSKISVEFDAANATWISHDVAIFSTKTGNLFLLSLVFDGRIVQRLELSKSRASVLSSCICTVGDTFFFLGSRLGDSLLVQFITGSSSTEPLVNLKTLKDEHDEIDEEIEGPSPKRLRRASSDVSHDAVSADELSLYYSSSATPDSPKKKTFTFAVRDSLVNIGPLRDFAYGFPVSSDSSASSGSKQSSYELVACSGHGKNGSISILQRSIRPELITEVELQGCKGIWTVYHKVGQSESSALPPQTLDEEEYHAYLIISLESRTMVLETGEMLGEVTESVDYYIEGPTIFAGNLFGRRRIVQVYARGVRLLDGAVMTQDLQIEHILSDSDSVKKDAATAIAFATIADPFILLQMTDGNIKLIVGDMETQTVSAAVTSSLYHSEDPVTACSLHHDKGHRWFRRLSGDMWHTLGVPDVLERDLGFSFDQGDIYCIICRESGKFEIYELPGMTCVYSVDRFTYGFSVLIDSSVSSKGAVCNGTLPTAQDESNKDSLPEAGIKLKVVSVCMETWGEKFESPFLFAVLNDGTLLCYHAFCYEGYESNSTVEEEGLVNGIAINKDTSSARFRNLRFVRAPLDLVSAGEEVAEGSSVDSQRIISFKNVGGMRGVFLTGARPMWLMLCRERIRPHPQYCDGSILAFTPLHNVNCTHGLIYVSNQGLLKICQLPSLINYDNDWPVQKVLLRGTPHQITYHGDTNLYALIVSFPVLHPSYMVFPALGDQLTGYQTDQMDSVEVEGGHNLVSTEDFEVRIMKPAKKGVVWEIKGTIKMQVAENAITARIVSIKNVTTDQMKNLLAIGTAYAQGEDVASRGRIILVVVGPESDDTNVWAKEIYSKELKGAISAIASLQGHLLVAIGTKIILHTWNGSELNGAAFFDAPLYVVSLNVKNFVLFGDIHKSIYFLCWKEEGAQLILLAKDFGSLDCFTTEFLIDGTTLSLLVSDSRKNVQIFSFAPKSVESWKGQKLLSRGEFHLGAHVAKFLRLQMLPTPSSPRSNRFALFFGTLDGSIAFIAPLDELMFRRLQTLQRKLVDAVPHVGGLNPRSFRQFRSDGEAHRPGPDNIVDCELLSQYEILPLDQQAEIARQIGTTRSQILSNFRDLMLSTNFF